MVATVPEGKGLLDSGTYKPARHPPGSPNGLGGKFLKGFSGFPGGALGSGREEKRKIRELARSMSEDMIHTLVEIAKDNKAHPSARVQASTEVLNRAFGRPDVSVDMTVKEVVRSLPDSDLDRQIAKLMSLAKIAVKMDEATIIDAEVIETETIPSQPSDHTGTQSQD